MLLMLDPVCVSVVQSQADATYEAVMKKERERAMYRREYIDLVAIVPVCVITRQLHTAHSLESSLLWPVNVCVAFMHTVVLGRRRRHNMLGSGGTKGKRRGKYGGVSLPVALGAAVVAARAASRFGALVRKGGYDSPTNHPILLIRQMPTSC